MKSSEIGSFTHMKNSIIVEHKKIDGSCIIKQKFIPYTMKELKIKESNRYG